MSGARVVTSRAHRATDTKAECYGDGGRCQWTGYGADALEGRRVQAAARNHAASTGHEVMVTVETHRTVTVRPRPTP